MEPVGGTRQAFQNGARVTECIHPGYRTAQLLLTYSIFLTHHTSDSREGFVERGRLDIVRASDPALAQSHSGCNSVNTAATCLTRRRRLDQWNIELSDSTGVSVLVISNVATRVVEVVVDKRLNCVDFIDGL